MRRKPRVHAAYDQVAQMRPQSTLVEGIAHVFNSDETLPFEYMGSVSLATPVNYKAGLINRVTRQAPGPAGASQVLGGSGGALSSLTGSYPVGGA